jgi:6-phosphogluconolactonase (cycloisomerase 2 family)
MLFYSGSDSLDGGVSDLVLWREDAGALEQVGSLGLRSPSWVVPHPQLPLLYATQESEPGEVVVVSVAPDGSLHELQRMPSQGGLPCHLAVDAAGAQLVVCNYADGMVASWVLTAGGVPAVPAMVWDLTEAACTAIPQQRANAHMAHLRGDTILVADLGGDALHELNSDGGSRVELSLPQGFGPRHFVMIGDDRAVIVGELSAELALVQVGPHPRVLDVVPTTTLGGYEPSGITARGHGVIVANRVLGSIAAFTVDGDRLIRGEEIRLCGDTPRAISSDDRRTFVCLPDVGLIATYTVGDNANPRLTRAPHVSDFGAIPWSLGSLGE